MNRTQKQEEVERLREELAKSSSVFVVNFQKIKVSEDFALRKQVRQAGGRYQVVKNKLAERGGEGTPAGPVLKTLTGATAIATSQDNPVALAKALASYAKENPNFTFRAGVVEGRVVSVAEIAELALLPGKEELLAKVLYLLASPARGIATAVHSVMRGIATALDQAVKENKFSS